MANILGTAQSALLAAQAGLATTGHNIANAKTPGYNRQIVVQAAVAGQNEGGGFIGKGTTIVAVNRIYNDYLGDQIRSINTVKGQLDSHYTEAKRINNLVADPTAGLSPVLQDFFKGVQALTGDASLNPSRQGVLAAAESLAGRFQSLNGQLQDMREAVNSQITTSVSTINSYAQQIANLNDAIGKAQGAADGQAPNDLLDQRDHLVGELAKVTQVSVIKEGVNYTVFVGNGQPLVIGPKASQLATVTSPTDSRQLQVGYVAGGGKVIPLTESSLPGGSLGGLFEFRAKTLDNAQNALGRIAVGLASTFNAQHKLGQDQTGAMGGNFFNEARPVVTANSFNTGAPPAEVVATIDDVSKLTTSNYSFGRDSSGNYTVTRLSDNAKVYSNAAPPTTPIDGINFAIASGTMANGDNFLVKPTINGAASFNVLVKDQANIASAVPVSTAYSMSNSGSGKIGSEKVDKNFLPSMVATAVTLNFVASVPATIPATGTLNDSAASPGTGFTFPVKVTQVDGTSTIYAAGTAVPYTAGATVTFGASLAGPPADVGGVSFQISGTPANGDTFTVKANPNAPADNRNMLLLGALQTANTMVNGTTSYQGAFGQMVSQIGNKTHELEVTKSAEDKLLGQVTQAQQSESGVNLDEEATNLIRYQQAYQAAAKVMQTVKEMFDVLTSLGN